MVEEEAEVIGFTSAPVCRKLLLYCASTEGDVELLTPLL